MIGWMEWLKQPPQNYDDWLEFVKFVVVCGLAMAVVTFANGGFKAAAVMYHERTFTVAEDGLWARVWKLMLFVKGENAFYHTLLLGIAVHLLGNDYAVLTFAAAVSIALAFVTPHHTLPKQTRIGVALGGFILSLIYLKCGGWEDKWPWVHGQAMLITWIAHLVPVGIISIAFELTREETADDANNTPRPP